MSYFISSIDRMLMKCHLSEKKKKLFSIIDNSVYKQHYADTP